MQEQQKKLLTVSEVSVYLNIKEKTIYANVKAGKIPCYKIGALIRFRQEEIDDWLASCRKENKPAVAKQPEQRKTIRRTSKLSYGHIDKITQNIIDEETRKYYHTEHGKSDRIEAQNEENNYGSI